MLTLAGGSYFASLPTWPHSESTQFTPSFPTFFFFLSLSPRAQLARFRVSCLGESGVTTLVKEPEAELIIVIKASYLHNTSQAEGTQSMFPGPGRKSCPASTLLCCCFPGGLEQRLGRSTCPHHIGPPQVQGGRKLLLKQTSARPPKSLESGLVPVPSKSIA